MMPVVLWWKRVAPWYIAVLLVVQAISGILLSMLYVPSEHAQRDDRGRVQALAYATGLVRLQVTSRADVLDTIARTPRMLLVSLDSAERIADVFEADARHISLLRDASGAPLVPSAAATSLTIAISNDAAGGAFIRRLHHANTIVLVLAVLLAFAAFLHGADNRLLWGTLALVFALCAAYTGRLLPDDVYALVSRSITSTILEHDAPFGGVLALLFGVAGSTVRALSTTATMHSIVLPACMVIAVVQMLRTAKVSLHDVSKSLLALSILSAVAYVVFSARIPLGGVFLPRDTMHGAAVTMDVQPWWPFRLPNNLITWLGAELASYLVLGVLVALLTMAWWQGRVGGWTVRVFIALVLLTIVLGTVL